MRWLKSAIRICCCLVLANGHFFTFRISKFILYYVTAPKPSNITRFRIWLHSSIRLLTFRYTILVFRVAKCIIGSFAVGVGLSIKCFYCSLCMISCLTNCFSRLYSICGIVDGIDSFRTSPYDPHPTRYEWNSCSKNIYNNTDPIFYCTSDIASPHILNKTADSHSNAGNIPDDVREPSIRIHKIHRIVIAEGIRRDAVVLLRQRVRGGPAGEVRVIEPAP